MAILHLKLLFNNKYISIYFNILLLLLYDYEIKMNE